MLQVMERCIVKNSKYENNSWKNSTDSIFLYVFSSTTSFAFLNAIWYTVNIAANHQSEQDVSLQNGSKEKKAKTKYAFFKNCVICCGTGFHLNLSECKHKEFLEMLEFVLCLLLPLFLFDHYSFKYIFFRVDVSPLCDFSSWYFTV